MAEQRRDQQYTAFVAGATPRLVRLAYLLIGDRTAAEDLVQDVLERLYVAWPRIGDPDAYARRALANASTSRWRHRSRRREVELTEAHDQAVPGPEPSERTVLLTALDALPTGQRAVVVLRFFEDLSVDQTAAVLGCSTGTVKSQTARALPRLRELLSDLNDLNEGTTR